MKLRNCTLLFALLFWASKAFCEVPRTSPILTFDTKETREDNLPRNFRDLDSLGLNAIASGQFSEAELLAVREKYQGEKIVIVDLRRESHGLINGEAVSWRAAFEKSNENKTVAEILADEKRQLNLAKKDKKIIIGKVLEKDKENGWYKEILPIITTVNKVATEEAVVKKNGFEYKRFAIQDHARPSEAELERIVAFIRALPQDQKVYVHCAAGKGRTTTFLTLYDIIKNGKTTNLKKIFKRQNSIGGARLDEISDKEQWRQKLSQERLKMIEDFYAKETAGK